MEPIAVNALSFGSLVLPDWHPRAADRTCPIRGFVIRHPDGPILVDTGVAADSTLINELYEPTVVPIVDALAQAGVDERDVVAIVNTHLHFDHCGQNRSLPSAVVYAQSAEIEASAVDGFTIPEWANVERARLRVVHGDEEIAPGVRILATPGHTPGHQSVLVATDTIDRTLVVGQCCYTCAEFERGEIVLADMHDESFLEIGRESLARLRALDVDRAHFSHDPTNYARRDLPHRSSKSAQGSDDVGGGSTGR